MDEVRVKRTELLEKVKANRCQHERTFREALAGYKNLAEARIKKLHAQAKQSLEKRSQDALRWIQAFDPMKPDLMANVILVRQHSLDLLAPVSHLDDYDQVIEMLSMSVQDELEIDSSEFTQYVMDRWQWQEEFRRTVGTYSTSPL